MFNGTASWLGISVNCGSGFTALSPRQALTAAPYALHAADAWSLNGNSGANPNANFLGTTDNASLTIRVSNTVAPGVYGATIAGGGVSGYVNSVGAGGNYATVGGGRGNAASGYDATVSGGAFNAAYGQVATIGGGVENTASGLFTTVGGGQLNTASGPSATIGGGYNNTASGLIATIGGANATPPMIPRPLAVANTTPPAVMLLLFPVAILTARQ